MRVQITARHCEVPSDVIKRTEELIPGLSKYSPKASAAEVIYAEEKLTKVAEIIVHIHGDEPVVARGEAPEFRAALDEVIERIGRRLRRQRDRHKDHQAPPLVDRLGSE